MDAAIDVPVVIVGGGSCGLNLSVFLSDLGVEHVLFERHQSTSILPKAHVISQRTMEIFRQHGIADAILKEGAPPRQNCRILWQTSLGGDGPLDRKVLGTIDAWGCDAESPRHSIYQRDAPHLPSNLPLLRSEPIFRAMAETRNPGKVLFGHTVTDFEDQGECVAVHVRRADGKESVYRAKYLVGADGGKTIGHKIGVEMGGVRRLRQVVSTHFRADLSQYWDDRTGIAHFADPEAGAVFRSGSILPLGPSWGRHSEEWQIHFGGDPDDPSLAIDDPAACIRGLLKLPDLQVEVLGVSNWVLERVVANKYMAGRIFIGGDAAHRHPPTTGLGLNAAVQDAHNLAWKLAYALRGVASPRLLDTYDLERRPVGRRICDWALFTYRCHGIINAAIGLKPGQSEANRAHLSNLFDEDSETGRAGRAVLQHAIDGQAVEFGAHNMDLGFFYGEGAFVSDGTKPPRTDSRNLSYTPTTRPGHRLPHVWLERDKAVVSTHDLLGCRGDFLLIADRYAVAWIGAIKREAEAMAIGLRVAKISRPLHGAQDDEYVDCEGRWSSLKGVGDGGAILVRPDGVIGWRSEAAGPAGAAFPGFRAIFGISGS